MAREIYEKYQKEMGNDEQLRLGMPSLDRIRYQAFVLFLNNEMLPEELRMGLINRLKIERPDLFEKLQSEDIKFIEEIRQRRQEQKQP